MSAAASAKRAAMAERRAPPTSTSRTPATAQAPTVVAVNGHPVAATGGPGRPPGVIPVQPKPPEPAQGEKKHGGLGGIVHAVLDGAGMVPLIGEPADGLNGAIYAAEGDALNAGLSFAAMAPIAGNFVTGGKYAVKGAKAAEKIADGATNAEKVAARRTWKESEEVVASIYGGGFARQQSFKNGKPVPYGTRGSSRPDLYDPETNTSVEVKNYLVDSARRRSSLVRSVSKAAKLRATNLPDGVTQKVAIDLSGQELSRADRLALAERIVARSGGNLRKDDIEFLSN